MSDTKQPPTNRDHLKGSRTPQTIFREKRGAFSSLKAPLPPPLSDAVHTAGLNISHYGSRAVPSRHNLAKLESFFTPADYDEYVRSVIEYRVAQLTSGHCTAKSAAHIFLALPQIYWRAVIDKFLDPIGWEARVDKPSWYASVVDIQTRNDYVTAMRELLDKTTKDVGIGIHLDSSYYRRFENGGALHEPIDGFNKVADYFEQRQLECASSDSLLFARPFFVRERFESPDLPIAWQQNKIPHFGLPIGHSTDLPPH